jgi:Leucine-rich repeat (LRR) protein
VGVSRKKRVPKTQLNGSLAAARAAVGTSWLGMTLVQSRLLVIQLAALLAASGGIFTWYNKYFSVFYQQHPVLAPVFLGAIPLHILCFSVGPQMWQRRRQAQRESIALAPDPAPGHARYFRLDPYVTASPQEFRREDDAHKDVLRWIGESTRPVLFLSGVSGAGKTSVLEAYVFPELREAGWKVEQVRSFDDPLPRLETILAARRRKGTRLLVVFDQFEEFVILEDRASAEARRQFVARVQEIFRTPPAGLCLLFAFRRDYMSEVIAMQIDDLVPGRTFMEIDAFRRGAARRFLEASPPAPSSELVDKMLSGAEALDDVPARFRPVTLNMLGLALEEYDREVGGRPERLVQSYVEAAMFQPEIKEIAPRLIERMITEANTKRPRTVAEVAAETGLSRQDVVACLVLLERKGLMRRLDALWEISHDFVARQFALALGRLRPNPWRKVGMFAVAAVFVLMLVAVPLEIQIRLREQAYEALQRHRISVTIDPGGGLVARLPPDADDAALTSAMPYLILIEISGLAVGYSQVTHLPSLDKLTALRTLDLGRSKVKSLPSLDKLTALQTLDLNHSQVTDLPSLDKLSGLQILDLSNGDIMTLPSLDGLSGLTTLDLGSSIWLKALPSLDKLTSLRMLDLSSSGVTTLPSFDNLTSLTKLNLRGSKATTLPSLDKLAALTTLDLKGSAFTVLPSLDGLTALTELNLDGSKVTTLPSLDKLTALTALDISYSEVTTLPSLDNLTSLTKLSLTSSRVRVLSSLDKLTKLRELVLMDRGDLLDDSTLRQLRARGVKVNAYPDRR